jgi:hypothetical protein
LSAITIRQSAVKLFNWIAAELGKIQSIFGLVNLSETSIRKSGTDADPHQTR